MGYCMTQGDTCFSIPKKLESKALAAIKKLAGQETVVGSWGRHFSWVDSFSEAKTLEWALKAWRWEADREDSNDIDALWFRGEKLGDDYLLFKAIAPYVKAGSYINMRGEDGSLWQWYFNGVTCIEKIGKVTYE